MAKPVIVDEIDASDSDSDGLIDNQVRQLNGDRSNGQLIIKNKQVILETNDEIKVRARRPMTNKHDMATTLNFQGRVKMSSSKNAQLEYKFKTGRGGQLRMVL